jgi:ribonuclease P protein component
LEPSVSDKTPSGEITRKRLCYKKHQRLLNARDYKSVFDKNDFRASHRNILILARLSEKNYARLGLVFGKKFMPRSVDRNRLKRISREQFRLRGDAVNLDIIILGRGDLIKLTSDVYKKLILDLMENIMLQNTLKQGK